MTLEIFSNLNDSVMLYTSIHSFLLPVKPWRKDCTRITRLLHKRESPVSPQLSQTTLV